MAGNMALRGLGGFLAAAVLLVMPARALAGESGEYSFTVLRDGRPIGQHRIAIDLEGDRVEINEATDIQVRFAGFTIYKFFYRAHQLWQNGRAVRIDAQTDNNGEMLEIAVRPDGDGYVRTVNGRTDRFSRTMHVFALWTMDTLKYGSFFSIVEDETLQVSFKLIGRERLEVADQAIAVDRYEMSGSERRELWFDTAGHLVKLAFRRGGSNIEYLRDQLTPHRVTLTCAQDC